MKKILLVTSLILLGLSGCQQPQPVYVQQPQQIDYSQQQYQQVPVNYNGQTIFMDYLLYTSLMRGGGVNNVYHYYYSHPNDIHISHTRRIYSRSNPYPGSRGGYIPNRGSNANIRPQTSRSNGYSNHLNTSNNRPSTSRSNSYGSSRPSSSRSSSGGGHHGR